MPKILVVDDEKSMVELQKGILETAGHEIISAHNANAALEILKEHKPDLIILDLMMPDMNGIELCKKLRENKALDDIKLIFVTVMGESDFWSEDNLNPRTHNLQKVFDSTKNFENINKNDQIIRDLGVNGYLTKPFNNDSLIRMVNDLLE